MQPGIFALSGWDLVGAYPLSVEEAKELINKDLDNRWINRGAYDLLGENSEATRSPFGIPKAKTLYGSLPYQLNDPHSFVSQLKKYLRVRKIYKIPFAQISRVVHFDHPSLFGILYTLPQTNHLVLCAMNFGTNPVSEKIKFSLFQKTNAINLMEEKSEKKEVSSKKFLVKLNGLEGKVILFRPYREILSLYES